MSVLPIRENPETTPEPQTPEAAEAWLFGWPQTPEEFERLVEAYLDRLVLYAFHRLRNVQDAEDVVQEVFARAFAERSKRKKVLQAKPYLYRMVANTCTDLLRKRKRRGISLEEIGSAKLRDKGKNPSEEATAAEEAQRAEALLAHLPQAQAETFRLRVFEELQLSEIAEVLGCSINTVCSRLRYGFKKLRKILAREQG